MIVTILDLVSSHCCPLLFYSLTYTRQKDDRSSCAGPPAHGTQVVNLNMHETLSVLIILSLYSKVSMQLHTA